MKKIGMAIICAALAIGVMSGCGKKEAPQEELNLPEIAQNLQTDLTFKDSLNQLDDTSMGNFYPSVDLNKVEEYVIYVSGSGSTAEEIALFEVKAPEDTSMIKSAIEERVTDQTISFQDYVPEEMVKIENAVVKASGNYVFAVLCDDYDKAGKLLSEYLQ